MSGRIHQLLEKSYIMLSALEAEDMDLFVQALDERAEILESLEASPELLSEDEAATIAAELSEIHIKCTKALQLFKANAEKELEEQQTATNEAMKRNRAQQQYQGGAEEAGGIFDKRK